MRAFRSIAMSSNERFSFVINTFVPGGIIRKIRMTSRFFIRMRPFETNPPDQLFSVCSVNAVYPAVGSFRVKTDPADAERVFRRASLYIFLPVIRIDGFDRYRKFSFRRQIIRFSRRHLINALYSVILHNSKRICGFIDDNIRVTRQRVRAKRPKRRQRRGRLTIKKIAWAPLLFSLE